MHHRRHNLGSKPCRATPGVSLRDKQSPTTTALHPNARAGAACLGSQPQKQQGQSRGISLPSQHLQHAAATRLFLALPRFSSGGVISAACPSLTPAALSNHCGRSCPATPTLRHCARPQRCPLAPQRPQTTADKGAGIGCSATAVCSAVPPRCCSTTHAGTGSQVHPAPTATTAPSPSAPLGSGVPGWQSEAA